VYKVLLVPKCPRHLGIGAKVSQIFTVVPNGDLGTSAEMSWVSEVS